MEAEKLGVEIDNVQTRVELDRSKENKTIFNYEINFDNNLPQEKEEKLLKAVENCPVKQTLRNEIEFSKNL